MSKPMPPKQRVNPSPDVGVVMPAAGRGNRAGPGEPKALRPIAGIPMVLRALRPFVEHPAVRQVVIALPAEICTQPPDWLRQLTGERVKLVVGGETRAASVAAGLLALDRSCTTVLVHDAARPFVARETIDRVISTAQGGVGAVAALPVSDTIKRADLQNRVAATVDRSSLWRAQTPQGFPRAMLEAAYRRLETDAAAHNCTDDAELAEPLGLPVLLIADLSSNIKLTTPEDFRLAEALATR